MAQRRFYVDGSAKVHVKGSFVSPPSPFPSPRTSPSEALDARHQPGRALRRLQVPQFARPDKAAGFAFRTVLLSQDSNVILPGACNRHDEFAIMLAPMDLPVFRSQRFVCLRAGGLHTPARFEGLWSVI